MDDEKTTKVHWSFWLIGLTGIFWNLMGIVDFFVQTNPKEVAAYSELHRAIVEGQPTWVRVGFGMAVFGGAFASLQLLLKKLIATHLYVISFIGVVMTMVHIINVVGSVTSVSASDILTIGLAPLFFALALIWYSRLAKSKQWIS